MMIKKSVLVCFIVLIVITLSGCEFDKPEIVVDEYLNAVKNTNFKKAHSLTAVQNRSLKEKDIVFDNPHQEKLIKTMFSSLSYKILDVKNKNSRAQVEVSITSPDLGKIIKDTIYEFLPMALETIYQDNENANKELETIVLQHVTKSISKSNCPKTTDTVTFNLKRGIFLWKVIPDEKILDALTGNILDAAR